MWNLNLWKPAFLLAIGFIIWERLPPIVTHDLSDDDHPKDSRLLFPHSLLNEPVVERRLETSSAGASSGAASAAQASGDSESHGGHSSHPHDALFFMFNALIVGTIVLHLTTLPKFHGLQQTVCLFVLGMFYSLVQEGLGLKDDIGVFGTSYSMWMNIDPHLLLFTMLPALLAGDAMTIDTTVARMCAKQCMFLAGPGVLFGSFVTATFLYGYFTLVNINWNFTLCLVCGSILAATDPVAVVGLLKELGASPTLTIQIQGESLLNDGTAIVLYTVAYNILSGKKYDATEVMIYLVLCVCCAIGLGVVIGFIFYFWIRSANNRLDHCSGMIQTALSICCAYWAFCIAEGALHWSGVLCTVSASLVMADKMWPQIVDKDSLLHIWHMIEYLGNTIIFFLAGALTGNAMVKIDIVDYLHLIVIYCACMLIRASLLFGTRPILNFLGQKGGQPISLADVTVMTWGGLRGAVGLALAIQVSIDQAGGEIAEEDGRRVLFYVGGIAAMTLTINAPTCPGLVRKLGITKTPAARQGMLYRLHSQLRAHIGKGPNSEAARHSMQALVNHIAHEIDHLVPANKQDNMEPEKSHLVLLSAVEICERFEESRATYDKCVKKGEVHLLDMPTLPFVAAEEKMMQHIREHDASPLIVKATYEAFLSLVQYHYWQQIDAGEFVDGTGQGEMLLNSVAMAFSGAGSHLSDLKYVMQKLVQSHEDNAKDSAAQMQNVTELLAEEDKYDERCTRSGSKQKTSQRASLKSQNSNVSGGLMRTTKVGMALQALPSLLNKRKQQPDSCLHRFLASAGFMVTMSVILLLNALFILVEQTQRKGDNYHHKAWLVVEIIFGIVFIGEFLIKLIAFRCFYFLDLWNIFDFLLVGLSVFGVVMELMDDSDGDAGIDDVSNEARLFRMNRLFRVLRIFRLFRLFKFAQIFQSYMNSEDISFELAEYLKTITVCRAFAIAHTRAQTDLCKFFGEEGEFANTEQMRCVLESQTEVYKVNIMAAAEANAVQGHSLVAMRYHREGIKASSKLRHFIHDAHHHGVISAREAETLTHPIDSHVKFESSQMKKTVHGRRASSVTPTTHTQSGERLHVASPENGETSRTSTKTSESVLPVSSPNGFILPKDVTVSSVS